MADRIQKDEVSVRINKASWLKNCRLASLDDGVVAWADFTIPPLEERDGDIIHEVEGVERPEQIARRYYGFTELWWVIALANDIRIPLVEFYPGRSLRIPDPQFILGQINSDAGVQ